MSNLNSPPQCGYWYIRYCFVFVYDNQVKYIEWKHWGRSPTAQEIWGYADARAKELASLNDGKPMGIKEITKTVCVDAGQVLRPGSSNEGTEIAPLDSFVFPNNGPEHPDVQRAREAGDWEALK